VERIIALSVKDFEWKVEFYIWFRWEAIGALEKYEPLKSMELMNGRIDGITSKLEKRIDFLNYAVARVTATVYKNWELEKFPFDTQRVEVLVEDSQFVSDALQFVPDYANSGLSGEIKLPGWQFSGFPSEVVLKPYKSNFGDISLPTGFESNYSRLKFGMDMTRDSPAQAFKLLGTAIIATLVAFIAFGIRATDVDPRFGLGVGALFAVIASSFIVASTVPDAGVLTIADWVHIVAMWFIFASLVQSAYCLKWDEAGAKAKSRRVDFWSIIIFPLLFLVCTVWLINMGVG